jgi:hypothetical protein
LRVPPEAEQAVAVAAESIRAHGLDVGELVACQRVTLGESFAAQALAAAPEGVRGRVGELLSRVPERNCQPHWQLLFQKPVQRGAEEPYLLAKFNVFDDGSVEFVGQH